MSSTYRVGTGFVGHALAARKHLGGWLGGSFSPASVAPHSVVLAAMASYAGQAAGGLGGWPLWAIVTATVAPWLPLVGSQLLALARREPWLGLLTLLTLSQVGHLGEHLAQMAQLHVLHLDGDRAHGIFGALDIEWVHFAWNTWVVAAVGALVASPLRRNPWLWSTLMLAGWHETEHVYILATYLATGVPGTPGLLAAGGAIGGGLGLARPDLHFIYNLAETVPLAAALAYQLRRHSPLSVSEPDPAGSPRATRVSEALLARLSFPTNAVQAAPPVSQRRARNIVHQRGALFDERGSGSPLSAATTAPDPRSNVSAVVIAIADGA